jgi:hypothetical protein
LALATLVVVAALVGVAVSVRQLQHTEDRTQQAQAATVAARLDEADLHARAADLEAVIAQLDLARQNHLATAQTIDETVANIAKLRTKVDALVAQLAASRADRHERQSRIDVLLRCRDALGTAVAQLSQSGVSAAATTAVLDAGRDRCQSALDLAQGDTGAVHPYDFPDPSVVLVGDTYYAYGTEGPGGPIQSLSSKDLRTWTVRTTVLANRPAWARPESTWAPTVQPIDGRFILYYATRSKISGQQCISSAIGLSPGGPFLDDSPVPIVCQDDLGGSIDPEVYTDEFGFAHLSWKSENETVGGVAHIWTQYLGPGGRSVVGLPTELLKAEQPWEDKTVENPSMVRLDGTWILLYSGNRWNSDRYAIGYAVCDGPAGPCHRPASPRVRTSGSKMEGPGGADAFSTVNGRTAVAYAAWDRGKVGFPNPRRLHLATISYRDGILSWQDQ